MTGWGEDAGDCPGPEDEAVWTEAFAAGQLDARAGLRLDLYPYPAQEDAAEIPDLAVSGGRPRPAFGEDQFLAHGAYVAVHEPREGHDLASGRGGLNSLDEGAAPGGGIESREIPSRRFLARVEALHVARPPEGRVALPGL
ncbi:hypothetical protein SDC9_197452 [bioreactor metagenome]|uniref:Uncharacterized protein n=1 Tax=bioreactor metagenome TaxID=1076179 RepID=A0A645IH76_9ZZZZ